MANGAEGNAAPALDESVKENGTKRPPRVCASWTSGAWQDFELSDQGEEVGQGTDFERKRKVTQAIGSLLGAEHLISVFGLGPSAGVGGPKMSDLWMAVRSADPALFAEVQSKVGDTTPETETGDIEVFLSKCQVVASAPLGPDARIERFIEAAERVIANECSRFVDDSKLAGHAQFLRLLAQRAPERTRARVFTTNYDLCIEKAAAQRGVLLIDGFGREATPVFDGTNYDVDFVRRRPEARAPEYLAGVIHLIKLHGSVDWTEEKGQIVRRESADPPVIIYPRRDKFEMSYRQPFLETMSQLQTSLRQPNLGLLIVGFSFADAHLSEMLLAAVRKNLGLRVVVATLACEGHTAAGGVDARPGLQAMQQLAAHGDARITLIDCDFQTLVRLLPDVGTETEEDRLKAIVRAITP